SGTGVINGQKDGLELQRNGLGNKSAQIAATGSGNIFLTGVLRGGNATDNAIKFGEDGGPPGIPNSFIVESNTGHICINAELDGPAANAAAAFGGLRTGGVNPTIQSTRGGNIIIRTDRLDLGNNTTSTTINSNGILAIQPFSAARNISLMGGGTDITDLHIDSGEWGRITAGNFSQIIIGDTTSAAPAAGNTLTVGDAVDLTAPARDLTLAAGNININNSINVGVDKHLRLWSNGGSVTQAATADITGNGLVLVGSSTFDLNNAAGNNFNRIATGPATGPIAYKDADTLIVGNVTLNTLPVWPNCCSSNATPQSYSGITTNNQHVIIETGGLLTLDSISNLGSGNLTLISNGGVTQNPTGGITAAGLGLQGNGTFDLNNASNDVDTFAANVNGGVSFVNNQNLTIGNVTSNTSSDIANTTGGINATGSVFVQTTTGNITLNQPVQSSGGNITLAADGNFINAVGSGALSAPSGVWLVYATSPGGNINGQPTLGGSEQFSSPYPTPATFSGNGFLYKVPAPSGGNNASSLHELLAGNEEAERSPQELEIVAEIGFFNSTEMCSNEAIEEEEEKNLPELLITRDSTSRYQGLNSFRVIQVGRTRDKLPTCQSKDGEGAQR
ncbi:hypothetical protein, partial [uncultured Thermosynechococcus sp.]|uniref:hypothetical protein n=1 Tax=uncultured Thermosynechococcus sp. TaxID=436945 RepID=UPI00261B5971